MIYPYHSTSVTVQNPHYNQSSRTFPQKNITSAPKNNFRASSTRSNRGSNLARQRRYPGIPAKLPESVPRPVQDSLPSHVRRDPPKIESPPPTRPDTARSRAGLRGGQVLYVRAHGWPCAGQFAAAASSRADYVPRGSLRAWLPRSPGNAPPRGQAARD